MKRVICLLVLLQLVCAVEVKVGSQFDLTGPLTINVMALSKTPVIVSAQWENTKIDIFPSQVYVTPIDGMGSANFLVMNQGGACGQADVIFTADNSRATTKLKLPDCVAETIDSSSFGMPVEIEYIRLRRQRIDVAEQFLQITPAIHDQIQQIEQLIAQAKAEPDYTRKAQVGDQAYRMLNDVRVALPYVVTYDSEISPLAGEDIRSMVEQRFGTEVDPIAVEFYKRATFADSQIGWASTNPTTVPFTLFKLRMYNPTPQELTVYVAENQRVDGSSLQPVIAGDLTVWSTTLPANGVGEIRFIVNKKADGAVATALFKAKPVQAPQAEEAPPLPAGPSQEENKMGIIEIIANIIRRISLELVMLADIITKK